MQAGSRRHTRPGCDMTFFAAIFWFSGIMLAYIYVGYPLFIWVVARYRTRPVQKRDMTPSVSVVIAAYNEAGVIEATVENKLAQHYPADKLEIVVVSDGSTDATDQCVTALSARYPGRVRLLRQEPRAGKTAALNMAIRELRGEIVVFADANSMYADDAIRALVRNFADPAVGYVTGKMVYASDDHSATGEGCSFYMRYENVIRDCETALGSIVGVDGGIDAVRKELFTPMRADQLPDFVLPLQVVTRNYRVVYEPAAVLREPALKSGADEYRMRVRVALRALWALWDMRHLLNPFRYGVFSVQLISHKVLRYLAFVFLLGTAASNVVLLRESLVYEVTGFVQILLYGLAGVGLLLSRSGASGRVFHLPYYFLLLNLASCQAFLKFLLRKKQVLWKPRLG